MKLSIFGLGYVGSVSAALFADAGHRVLGVDPNPDKVDPINQGRPPVIEPGLSELVGKAVDSGRLTATIDGRAAVLDSELSIVCVGTPSHGNGSLDLTYLRRVCREIGEVLAGKAAYHVVVIRSTMLPGTMDQVVIPTLEEHSGKRAGADFGVCVNPEFLREGSAVHDFLHPPKTVIGESDPRAGEQLARLYAGLDAPLIRCPVPVAEMVKYADNSWHAVKVAFGNEIGVICKGLGIDSHRVMEIFCRDTKLNLSPYYLKPGFAFGGSCLPKDLRALTYRAREMDLELPLLQSVLPSNARHLQRGLDLILSRGRRRIGILGFSFKAGTDDLRESPMVEVIEHLLGKGREVRIFDRNVQVAALTGANREFILKVIPHIARLMVADIAEVVEHAEVVVIGNGDPAFRSVLEMLRPDQELVDFVRLTEPPPERDGYHGICW